MENKADRYDPKRGLTKHINEALTIFNYHVSADSKRCAGVVELDFRWTKSSLLYSFSN